MRDSEALATVAERHRRTLLRLENERELPGPSPFDWRAWRRNRSLLVAKFRAARVYSARVELTVQEFLDSLHSPVDT